MREVSVGGRTRGCRCYRMRYLGTGIFTTKTARELLCQPIIPVMEISRFLAKLGKVGGEIMTLEVAVVYSQPTWEVVVMEVAEGSTGIGRKQRRLL